MEKTLYIDNTKFSVEVSKFDWHQSKSEIQCILVFLTAADKKRFLTEINDFYTLILEDMWLSQPWYNDVKDTQAITFGAYYSIPPVDENKEEPSLPEAFNFCPEDIIF